MFLEPEGRDTPELYVQGFSTGLPERLQLALLRTLPGGGGPGSNLESMVDWGQNKSERDSRQELPPKQACGDDSDGVMLNACPWHHCRNCTSRKIVPAFEAA